MGRWVDRPEEEGRGEEPTTPRPGPQSGGSRAAWVPTQIVGSLPRRLQFGVDRLAELRAEPLEIAMVAPGETAEPDYVPVAELALPDARDAIRMLVLLVVALSGQEKPAAEPKPDVVILQLLHDSLDRERAQAAALMLIRRKSRLLHLFHAGLVVGILSFAANAAWMAWRFAVKP